MKSETAVRCVKSAIPAGGTRAKEFSRERRKKGRWRGHFHPQWDITIRGLKPSLQETPCRIKYNHDYDIY